MVPMLAHLLVVSALAHSSQVPLPQEVPATAEVRVVVSTEDGEPAPGITVYSLPSDQLWEGSPRGWTSGTTDEQGIVFLEVEANSPLRFDAVSFEEGLVAKHEMPSIAPDSVREIALKLTPVPRSPVPLTFVDHESGKPARSLEIGDNNAKSVVGLNRGAGFQFRVIPRKRPMIWRGNELGQVDAAILEEGPHQREPEVWIRARGYVSTVAKWTGGERLKFDRHVVRIRPAPSFKLVLIDLPKGATVTAFRSPRARDLKSARLKPQRQRVVELTVESIEEHLLLVHGVPAGSPFVLYVDTADGERRRIEVRAPREPRGDGLASAELDLWSAGEVTGVITTRTGQPLPGGIAFLVGVESSEGSAPAVPHEGRPLVSVPAGADGRFVIRSVPAGDYRLFARRSNHREIFDAAQRVLPFMLVRIRRSEPTATLSIAAAPELRLVGSIEKGPGKESRVWVQDFADGRIQPESEAHLSSTGDFELGPFPPGLVTLRYGSAPHGFGRGARVRDNSRHVARVQLGARHLTLRSGSRAVMRGQSIAADDRRGLPATVVLQEDSTGVELFASPSPARPDGSFTFESVAAGKHILWAYTEDGYFASPKVVQSSDRAPLPAQTIELLRGAQLRIDAGERDRILRCDITLPSGQSLERILYGAADVVTLPAGPVRIDLEEVGGDWRASFDLDLQPGEIVERAAK